MALTSVKSIEEAFTLVDAKKESLKEAFKQLQSHSSRLSSLNFTWDDLDAYFTSVKSELLENFSTLQALESSRVEKPKPKPGKRKASFATEPVPARPELKSLCESMDGLGLRKFIIDRPKERTAVRVELVDAFRHASDPGSMVLDALEGFWDEKLSSSARVRTACVVLLEELMRTGVEIGAETRERARAVAAEWKEKIGASQSGNGGDGDDEGKEEGGLERLGYLQLLAAFKLVNDGGNHDDELIDFVVFSARYRQAIDLCRILGLETKVSDVINRLISKGKQLLALKFVFEYELTDEFPPVPLLKAFLMDSKKSAVNVRKIGKSDRQSLNDAAMKEISALKSVIKCIEDHGLESQYPKDELVACIGKLEKEKADRKRPVVTSAPKPQQRVKQLKNNANKRMKASAIASAFKRKKSANSVVLPSQPSSMTRAGFLADHAAPHRNPPAGAYRMAGPLVPAAPYVGPSADLYGLSGAPVGFSGNLNAPASNPYPSETHAQPGYYDRAVGYGGYDFSTHYHPAFYPQ